MEPVVIEHTPARPSWGCRVCGEAWPCKRARGRLRKEYAEFPTTTALYLSGQQRDYMADHPDFTIDQLYDRFLGWAR